MFEDGDDQDYDALTKACDRIGQGCYMFPVDCVDVASVWLPTFWDVLDEGNPANIKTFFNDPDNTPNIPEMLLNDSEFMAAVNNEELYTQFYTNETDPNRRVYLVGDHTDMTLEDRTVVLIFTY